MKRLSTMFFVLIFVLLENNTTIISPVYGEEQTPSDSAALVNGQAISLAELERDFQIYKQRLSSQGTLVTAEHEAELKQKVLNDLIGQELVFQASQNKGISVPPEEVDKVLTDIKKRYPDEETFFNVLQRMQMTEDQLRHKIAQQSAIRALIDQEIGNKIQIADQDAKTFYDANPQQFQQPEQVHARHILIKMEAGADEKQRTKAKEKILSIRKRAMSGEDFGELAKTESEGPSAPQGGDLGFFSKGRMVLPFEEAAFSLKIKEISDVVETNFGYHLIQVLEHQMPRTIPFEEVKDKIAANLRNEKISEQLGEYVSALRKAAKIETFVK